MTKTGVPLKRMVGWSLKPLWSDFRPRTYDIVELTNHLAFSLVLRASCFGPRASCLVLRASCLVLLDYGQCLVDEGLGGFVPHLRPPGTSWRCLDQISALNDCACNQIYLQPDCWKWATSESEYVALSLWIPSIKEDNGQDGRVNLPSGLLGGWFWRNSWPSPWLLLHHSLGQSTTTWTSIKSD